MEANETAVPAYSTMTTVSLMHTLVPAYTSGNARQPSSHTQLPATHVPCPLHALPFSEANVTQSVIDAGLLCVALHTRDTGG